MVRYGIFKNIPVFEFRSSTVPLITDRVGGKKPMEVLVERLVAVLGAHGPPLRVEKCEDCQIVEATKGQGEKFGYPAGTEPRWCPLCSQDHPGATVVAYKFKRRPTDKPTFYGASGL